MHCYDTVFVVCCACLLDNNINNNTYLILIEYEVNIGNKSRVKDRGEAEVFYEVFISYTDQVRSQY